MADQLFFEHAPDVVVLSAQQFDKTTAFNLVAQLTDIATLLCFTAGKGDLAILFRLGRRDQVQLKGFRLAVAAQAQVDFAGYVIKVNAGPQQQGLGQQLTIKRAVDAFAGLVVIIVDQVVRVVHRDGHHGQGQRHGTSQDGDDDPWPKMLVPRACGVCCGHDHFSQRICGPMNRLLASTWMLSSSASLRMNFTSLVLDGSFSGAMDSSTGWLKISPAATLISRLPCSLRSGRPEASST